MERTLRLLVEILLAFAEDSATNPTTTNPSSLLRDRGGACNTIREHQTGLACHSFRAVCKANLAAYLLRIGFLTIRVVKYPSYNVTKAANDLFTLESSPLTSPVSVTFVQFSPLEKGSRRRNECPRSFRFQLRFLHHRQLTACSGRCQEVAQGRASG